MVRFLEVAVLKRPIRIRSMWRGWSRERTGLLKQHFQLRLQPTVKSLSQLRPVSLLMNKSARTALTFSHFRGRILFCSFVRENGVSFLGGSCETSAHFGRNSQRGLSRVRCFALTVSPQIAGPFSILRATIGLAGARDGCHASSL